MKCAQCQLLIDEIGDMDRLPSDAARHLADCQACERFGLELISLRRLLREPARVTAPESFDLGLARRLRAAKSTPPSRLALVWALRPQASLAMAAAFLMVCSVTFVVSRYATSPDANPGGNVVVATNRAVETQPARTAESPGLSTSGDVASTTGLRPVVAMPGDSGRIQRAAGRPRVSNRHADTGDAMLLVSDDRGSRLVNVPGVLIGSEPIVPVASGEVVDPSETVSF